MKEKSDVIGRLTTISRTIHIHIAMGIEKYAKQFNVEVLETKGISEDDVYVSVRGKLEDLKNLNEKAKDYKPTVVLSKECR